MKKKTNANLPVLIFMLALLIIWQAGAMGMNAAYILPSPAQILVRLWELRKPLFTAHLPATMLCTGVGLAISVARAVICALVRLYNLEQGARDRAHHVLSDRDDGFRRLSFG